MDRWETLPRADLPKAEVQLAEAHWLRDKCQYRLLGFGRVGCRNGGQWWTGRQSDGTVVAVWWHRVGSVVAVSSQCGGSVVAVWWQVLWQSSRWHNTRWQASRRLVTELCSSHWLVASLQ